MEIINSKKDIYGIIFLVLSIITLSYIFTSPLNHMVVNFDELFTLTITNFPTSDILSITHGDFNPPFYYLLAKLAVKIFPNAFLSLKILSIIPYLFLLIISVTKIRKDYGWLTAGVFSFSIVVMSQFAMYALMARMYGWGILFTVLAFIYFKDTFNDETYKSWILFTVFAILASYTHYFAGLTVLCMYIFAKKSKETLISFVVLILAYIPWIFNLIYQAQAVNLPINLNISLIAQSLGYFAYSPDGLFCLIAVLILIAIFLIYVSQGYDKYILSGFGVFLSTVVLTILISIIFKPLLEVRFLIFAAAVLWLTLSVLISQINDKKLFNFAFILIVLLLVSGVCNMVVSNNQSVDENIEFNNFLSGLDNNSIVILSNPKIMMHFLNFDDSTDMYAINQSYVYGVNIDRVHKIFNFKDITSDEIYNLTVNSSGKNVYLIDYGDINLNNVNKTSTIYYGNVQISKLNATQAYANNYSEYADEY